MKRSFKELFMCFFGYKYLANKRSGEIHDLKNLHSNCNHNLIAKRNKQYLRQCDVDLMFETDEYNGCRWCMPEFDEG